MVGSDIVLGWAGAAPFVGVFTAGSNDLSGADARSWAGALGVAQLAGNGSAEGAGGPLVVCFTRSLHATDAGASKALDPEQG
jgi:hypothetical protein